MNRMDVDQPFCNQIQTDDGLVLARRWVSTCCLAPSCSFLA